MPPIGDDVRKVVTDVYPRVSSSKNSNGVTDVAGELAPGCASQAGPSNLTEGQFKDDVALIERFSRNGGLDWVDGRGVVIPVNVAPI